MSKRRDIYHPYTFSRFVVTKQDDSGNPEETVFYDDMGNELFKWIQTWNAYGKCISWEILIIKKNV